MSLKEAVSALRSLKTELEASRRANAELEAKNHKLAENLRAAGGAGIAFTENGHKDHDGGTTPSEVAELEEERAAALRLRKELLEAQEAASRLEGERRAMEEEARGARDELMTMTKRVADKSRELQEALSAKDEAIRAGEQALDRVKAAEDEAAKQETRASTAEEQLSGVTEDAESLRSRLEEMAAELESARDALSTEKGEDAGEKGGEGEEPLGVGGDEEDVAELESELRLVREAVAGQAPSASESATETEFLRVAAEEARQRAERLQAELDLAVQETDQLRKALENAQDQCRSAEDSAAAVAESLASEHERQMAEKNHENVSLQEKLALSEDALREAERVMATIEASARRAESARAAAVEETRSDMEALKVALAEAVGDREDTKRLAAEEKAAWVGEVTSLREELEMLRAELAKTEARANAAEEDAAAKAAVAASRVAELEARLEEAKEDQDAALKAAASKVLEMRRRESENAAAGEAKAAEVEATAEARVAEAVKARDVAEKEAQKASERVSAAQTTLARLKTKAAELKEGRAEAVRAAEEAQAERDSAVKAEATAGAARKDMEETLLMANKELQRLKVKCDEAIMEAEEARTESKRLKAELETSNSCAKGEGEEGTVQGESDAEIARLRKKIAELEERETDAGIDTETGEEDEIDESDRLRTELRQAREEAAVRTAGLETQLADKEREASDTQRRLYRRQSELEAELEEVRVNYDALRVEMARMDASMQDAADSRYDASGSSTGARGLRGRGSGSVGEDDIERKGFKDATALGAEVGSAVGGIFKGKLWSGWGHADGADEEAQGRRRGEPSPVRGRGRDGLMGAGPSSTSTAARSMRTSGARRREWVEDGDTDRQEESISRVRDNIMARLHEAAGQPMSNERMTETGDGDNDEDKRKEEGKAEVMDGEDDNASHGDENLDARAGRARSTEGGWVEETVEHPAPDYGLSSPVIRYLLQQWSSDPEKLRYLSLWLRCVVERRKVPDAFPSGLQLVGLAPEIKDGFLTLVIPIIRHTGGVPVLVHSRRSPPDERASDGDAANEEELWDLRVKVDLQRTIVRRSGELSDGSRETGRLAPSGGPVRRGARRSKGGAPAGKT